MAGVRFLIAAAAVGAVGVVLAPIVLPTLVRSGRPAAKTAVKTAVMVRARAEEAVAELLEIVEDAYAEAEAEIAGEEPAGGGTDKKPKRARPARKARA